jgi:hypothetical protein
MRGKTVGNWRVIDYLFAEDFTSVQTEIDPDTGETYRTTNGWTDHWWKCQCVMCGRPDMGDGSVLRGMLPCTSQCRRD